MITICKFIVFALVILVPLNGCKKSKQEMDSRYNRGEMRSGVRGTFSLNSYGEYSCGELFDPDYGQEDFHGFAIKVINCPDSVFTLENWGKQYVVSWEFLGLVHVCVDGRPDYPRGSEKLNRSYLEMVRIVSIERE